MADDEYLGAYAALCRRAFGERDPSALRALGVLLDAAPSIAGISDSATPTTTLGHPFAGPDGRVVRVTPTVWEAMERVKGDERREAHRALASRRARALADALDEAPTAPASLPFAAARHRQRATRDATAALVSRAPLSAAPLFGALFVGLDAAVAASPRGVLLWLPDAAFIEASDDTALIQDAVRLLRHTLGCEPLPVVPAADHRPWRVGVDVSDSALVAALCALPVPVRTLLQAPSGAGGTEGPPPTALAIVDIESGSGLAAAAEQFSRLVATGGGPHPYRAYVLRVPRYRRWRRHAPAARGVGSRAAAAAGNIVAAPGAVTADGSVREGAADARDADLLDDDHGTRTGGWGALWPCPIRDGDRRVASSPVAGDIGPHTAYEAM